MINSLKTLSEKAGFEYFGDDVCIESISINSKDIGNKCLFVAIIAKRDGHLFVLDAIKNKAAAILVSNYIENTECPQIVCENTFIGLQKLAIVWRSFWTMPVIAITGSCGKTTVKEMIVSILSQQGKTSFTDGNLNNQIGVPITILQTPLNAEYVVIEAGTDSPGEISILSKIILPTVAVITNIAASHLNKLKSIDGVLKEKISIFKNLSKNGFAIINLDDPFLKKASIDLKCNKLYCSTVDKGATISCKYNKQDFTTGNVDAYIQGSKISYSLPVISKAFVIDSLLAATVCYALSINTESIESGLNNFKGYKSRCSLIKINNTLSLIDDTYNASFPSVKSAIELLANFKGIKIFVMSSMKDLGDHEEYYHHQMGVLCNDANFDYICFYGDKNLLDISLNQIKNNAIYFNSKNELVDYIKDKINNLEDTRILIKGSRYMKMEDAVSMIKNI